MTINALDDHSGRELELMLSKRKPLSMFYDDASVDRAESVIPEDEFDKYVEGGLFAKGTRVFELAFDPRTGQPHRVKYVLYALKEEEWRIPAMFLVLETDLRIKQREEGIQRMIGALLGYTDQEIDDHWARHLAYVNSQDQGRA
jgi:hypothetical protein